MLCAPTEEKEEKSYGSGVHRRRVSEKGGEKGELWREDRPERIGWAGIANETARLYNTHVTSPISIEHPPSQRAQGAGVQEELDRVAATEEREGGREGGPQEWAARTP